ncbi:MAG: plasmid encoded RepA protein [Bryobacterales bacterium]|nr:plasmid encoded RepA protein [Bryobacterales bacterium]
MSVLRRTGDHVLELFESQLREAPVSQTVIARSQSVELVRRRREDWDQSLAFGARPFILCGLPIRQLPAGTSKYVRRNGRLVLEVVGHPEYGIPFGQDRLILLWVGTVAVRQKSPIVEFDSGAEILNEWGLQQNGSHYKRLAQGFRRVFGSTIFFGSTEERKGSLVWDCGRIHFFDQMRLWLNCDDSGDKRRDFLTLSDQFWQELKSHPIPVDCEVVRSPANNPGCLDLYTWLSWRCFQAKGPERVPLFGPLGLSSQLGVQAYARERKFRERVRSWLHLVRLYWPECPAFVSRNGAFLELNRSIAVLPKRTA